MSSTFASRLLRIDKSTSETSSSDEAKDARLVSVASTVSSDSNVTTKGTSTDLVSSLPPWLPSFLRLDPLLGIASLGLAFCCIFVALGILLGSNNQPTHRWTWQPTVYLAIATAISNSCLHFALAQAIPTAWWYKACRGSTITELHRQWQTGQSLFRALAHGKHLSLLTIASISSALVVVDGPLLQRASSVAPFTYAKPQPLIISISPEIPRGFACTQMIYQGGRELLPGQATIDVDTPWRRHAPITIPGLSCPGECYTTIQAPAAEFHCNSSTWQIDNATFTNPNASWIDRGFLSPNTAFFIMISGPGIESGVHPQADGLTVGRINVSATENNDVSGSFNLTTCSIHSAIAEYNIAISNTTISYSEPPSNAKILALANNTDYTYGVTNTSQPDTFGGMIATSITGNISANTSYSYSNGIWSEDMSTVDSNTMAYQIDSVTSQSFSDPIPEIKSQINDLFFRAGVYAAQNFARNVSELIDEGLKVEQRVESVMRVTELSYVSDLRWWAGAAAIQLLATLAILPVFWGYWRLGLPVTLSPFEVANFFDAPMLEKVPTSTGAKGVVRHMGHERIKLAMKEQSDVEVIRS